jgi:hypothetical protein
MSESLLVKKDFTWTPKDDRIRTNLNRKPPKIAFSLNRFGLRFSKNQTKPQ